MLLHYKWESIDTYLVFLHASSPHPILKHCRCCCCLSVTGSCTCPRLQESALSLSQRTLRPQQSQCVRFGTYSAVESSYQCCQKQWVSMTRSSPVDCTVHSEGWRRRHTRCPPTSILFALHTQSQRKYFTCQHIINKSLLIHVVTNRITQNEKGGRRQL
jgi:hypothetical protein